MKWMSWESCHFAPAVGKIIEQGIEEFRRYAAVANAQLEKTKFLAGDKPTLADFAVSVWLGYEKVCGLPVNDHPHLSRWWKAMQDIAGGSELTVPKQ